MSEPSQSERRYENGVTVGIVRAGAPISISDTAAKMEARHAGGHDTVVVFCPEGTAADVRNRIWAALEAVPRQDAREFERDQATAYEGNLNRMFGNL